MTLNVPLAEKVLSMVHVHPERHYQGCWLSECGTTACIAGHAMLASGEYVRKPNEFGEFKLVDKETGNQAAAAVHGARLLGLDYDVAQGIFMDMDERSAIRKLQRLVDEAKHNQHHPHPTKEGITS